MYNNISLFLIIFFLFHLNQSYGQELNRYEFSSVHMGTEFQIILYAKNDSLSQTAADAAFSKIEDLNSILSDYIDDSELNSLSNTAGTNHTIHVSDPLFYILKRSEEISNHTNGFFDITIGPFSKIWRGINRELDPNLPDKQELKLAQERVGYQYIELNDENQTVKLLKSGMRLDPGGIGKGFASDQGLETIREYGISKALINAGGDISVGDPPPEKDGWKIAIPVFNQPHINLIISNKAVITSGSLHQHVEIDGVKYSHIINPKTGLGNTNQIQVTVVSKNGTDADAYATAFHAMGLQNAKKIVKTTSEIDSIIQTIENDTLKIWASDDLEID